MRELSFCTGGQVNKGMDPFPEHGDYRVGMDGGVTDDGYQDWYDAILFWAERNLSCAVRVDDVKSIHYKAFLTSFDDMFLELTRFRNVESYPEALEFLRKNGLSGFEAGIASVPAVGVAGGGKRFRVV